MPSAGEINASASPRFPWPAEPRLATSEKAISASLAGKSTGGKRDKDTCRQRARYLHILLLGDGEAAVDGCRGRSPVLVELEADCAGIDYLSDTITITIGTHESSLRTESEKKKTGAAL